MTGPVEPSILQGLHNSAQGWTAVPLLYGGPTFCFQLFTVCRSAFRPFSQSSPICKVDLRPANR